MIWCDSIIDMFDTVLKINQIKNTDLNFQYDSEKVKRTDVTEYLLSVRLLKILRKIVPDFLNTL